MDNKQFSNEISDFEKDLPLPYAFKRLISLYRKIGKEYKKDGNHVMALQCFDKMLSLSKLWHMFYGQKTSGITGMQVDKAEKSLSQFLSKHHTLYPYTFQQNGAIPNDAILSATDYKNLEILTETIVKGPSREISSKIGSKRKDLNKIRADNEQGIGIRWIEGHKLGKTKAKAAYLGVSGNALSIEIYALEHYQSLGYVGYWTENEYWWAIMALLFWDVIFINIPGAYSSKVRLTQDMPDDFFSDNFYARRKNVIEKRISELSRPSLFGLKKPSIEMELISSYKKHYGQPCRPMIWEKYPTVNDLLLAAKTLNNVQLMGILKRLLVNFNENRRGLPDLFLVKDDSPIFVEVKSEKEKVADHQYRWLNFIKNDLDILSEICRVISTNR